MFKMAAEVNIILSGLLHTQIPTKKEKILKIKCDIIDYALCVSNLKHNLFVT